MISTRVMDMKLREAAEGLGEDGTGEAPCLGKSFVWLDGALGLCLYRGVVSPTSGLLRHPRPMLSLLTICRCLAASLSCCSGEAWGLGVSVCFSWR